MEIMEAINLRKSIRSFKPDPVPKDIIEKILINALRAPSWANSQPWGFAAATGKELSEIRRRFVHRAEEEPCPDIPHPREFPEPYEGRRNILSSKQNEILGLKKEDRERRGWWRIKGLQHFGAPTVIYIHIDKSFYFQNGGTNVWPIFDCGSIATCIMLLATSYGLGTVAQAQAVIFPDIIKEVLKIPDDRLIVVGIAIGYPDWDDKINQYTTERVPVDKITRWYGFDG